MLCQKESITQQVGCHRRKHCKGREEARVPTLEVRCHGLLLVESQMVSLAKDCATLRLPFCLNKLYVYIT